MALELTREQQQAVDAAGGEPVQVVDPRTQRAFMLVPAERYRDGHSFPAGGDLPAESQLLPEIPAGFLCSKKAFLRDLPALLKQKRRRGHWVAYHGDKRLGFGTSQAELYQKVRRQGLTGADIYVGRVRPHPPEPEVVDWLSWEFTDHPVEWGAEA
jgi:hypothetical protein